MAKNNAILVDPEILIQAGIDPKTGLPMRYTGGSGCNLKTGIKRAMRIIDEQDAVNRYKWYGIAFDLTSQDIERLIYYKGQLAAFFIPQLGKFYLMPYALSGGIDFYGRFKKIHPVPMSAGTSEEDTKDNKAQRDYLSTVILDVVYDIPLQEVNPAGVCVLLHDYTKQLSQTIIPRQELQEPILDVMSDMIPYARTAAMNSTGVQAMRVTYQDEYSNVESANETINHAALTGKRLVPVEGQVDFQDLSAGNVAKSEEYLLLLQSLDNFRLSAYGLKTGGLFQKKSHILEAEQEVNESDNDLVMNDGLAIRQHFCNVFNSIFGTQMWCELSETVSKIDKNGDGELSDEQDQSGTQTTNQPEVIE